MAQYLSFPIIDAGQTVTKQTIATTASGAEIVIGRNKKFTITSVVSSSAAPASFQVKFGRASLGSAAATDMMFSAGPNYILDSSVTFTSIRVYNPTGANADVYVTLLG